MQQWDGDKLAGREGAHGRQWIRDSMRSLSLGFFFFGQSAGALANEAQAMVWSHKDPEGRRMAPVSFY
jgi:hypothetical protein